MAQPPRTFPLEAERFADLGAEDPAALRLDQDAEVLGAADDRLVEAAPEEAPDRPEARRLLREEPRPIGPEPDRDRFAVRAPVGLGPVDDQDVRGAGHLHAERLRLVGEEVDLAVPFLRGAALRPDLFGPGLPPVPGLVAPRDDHLRDRRRHADAGRGRSGLLAPPRRGPRARAASGHRQRDRQEHEEDERDPPRPARSDPPDAQAPRPSLPPFPWDAPTRPPASSIELLLRSLSRHRARKRHTEGQLHW